MMQHVDHPGNCANSTFGTIVQLPDHSDTRFIVVAVGQQ